MDVGGETVTRRSSLGTYPLRCRVLAVGVAAGRVKDDVSNGFASGRALLGYIGELYGLKRRRQVDVVDEHGVG